MSQCVRVLYCVYYAVCMEQRGRCHLQCHSVSVTERITLCVKVCVSVHECVSVLNRVHVTALLTPILLATSF